MFINDQWKLLSSLFCEDPKSQSSNLCFSIWIYQLSANAYDMCILRQKYSNQLLNPIFKRFFSCNHYGQPPSIVRVCVCLDTSGAVCSDGVEVCLMRRSSAFCGRVAPFGWLVSTRLRRRLLNVGSRLPVSGFCLLCWLCIMCILVRCLWYRTSHIRLKCFLVCSTIHDQYPNPFQQRAGRARWVALWPVVGIYEYIIYNRRTEMCIASFSSTCLNVPIF